MLGVLASVPVTPDGPTARDWLRVELLKPEYQPSLIDRIKSALLDLLHKLAGNGTEFSSVVRYVLLLGAVILIGIAVSRWRGRISRNRAEAEVFEGGRRSAREHRRLAEAAFASEDWRTATIEGMRALTAELVEREVVPDAPALTVGEVVARSVPRYAEAGIAAQLTEAGRVFDETVYGDRPATRARARALLDLDERLRSASPSHATGPTLAVPR